MIESRIGKKEDKPHFKNIDGLRFLAAMAVLIFHAFALRRENWGDFTDSTIYKVLYKVSDKGDLGVNFFFVLSGFLITYLLLWERKQKGKIEVLKFLGRRTLRIWPLYFLIVIFGFFVFPHLPFGQATQHEYVNYLIFLPNIDEILHGANDSLNFLTTPWSVGVEEQFYISWAIIIGLIKFSKNKTYVYFFVGIILLSLVFRWFYLGEDRVLYYHSFSVMGDLAFGGIVGLLIFKGKLISWFSQLSKLKIILIYLLGFAIVFLKGKIFVGDFQVVERLVLCSFFAFILLEQVYCKASFFKADKFTFARIGGKISFGIYLYHCIVIYYLHQLFGYFEIGNGVGAFVLFILSTIVLSYAIAYISYYTFEKWFLKFKQN